MDLPSSNCWVDSSYFPKTFVQSTSVVILVALPCFTKIIFLKIMCAFSLDVFAYNLLVIDANPCSLENRKLKNAIKGAI